MGLAVSSVSWPRGGGPALQSHDFSGYSGALPVPVSVFTSFENDVQGWKN